MGEFACGRIHWLPSINGSILVCKIGNFADTVFSTLRKQYLCFYILVHVSFKCSLLGTCRFVIDDFSC